MAIEIARIAIVVLSYWTISISMVFANKYLVGEKSSVDISLFVSWTQCIATVLLLFLFTTVRALLNGKWENTRIPYSAMIAKPVLQMSFCFVLMLSFNNMCLKLVGVSFYQVARSTTIIFVVIFSVTLLKQTVSKWIVGCCLLVATGFFLGIDQEKVMGSLSMQGVGFGVASSIFIALTGIFTKTALEVFDRNELKLTMCTNAIAIAIFIPVVVGTGQFTAALSSGHLADTYFWIFLFISGILGTMMAWISAVQINVTSPVTHHISANTKAILQTLIAVVYYHETKSGLWWISVLFVVAGACLYAVRRYHEEKSTPAEKTTAPDSSQQAVIIDKGSEKMGCIQDIKSEKLNQQSSPNIIVA